MHPIERSELLHVQIALLIGIILQLSVSPILSFGPPYIIAALELALVFAIGFTAKRRHRGPGRIHRTLSILLLGLITMANVVSLILLVNELLHGFSLPGKSLLFAAMAIYVTNIIYFGIWYWEIDSPGLTGFRLHNSHPHFLFIQNREHLRHDHNWRPRFFDYFYTSLTNGINFSSGDAMPLTHQAKAMMGVQSLIAVTTIVLVTARAVTALAT